MLVKKWLNKAREEEKKNRWQEAANNYQKILSKDSENAEAVYGLGELLLRANQVSRALELYLPLYQSGKLKEARHCCGFARVLRRHGQLQQSANVYQQVLACDEQYADAWLGLGEVLSLAGDHVRAAGSFKRLVSLKPDEDYFAALFARELIESHRYGLARTMVKQLCQRMPQSVSMQFAHADVLAKLGQNLLAIDVLNGIERNEKTFLNIDMRLAQACLQAGDSAGFEDVLERLLAKQRMLSEDQRKMLSLWQCRSLLQKGEKEIAGKQLLGFIDENPNFSLAWQLLADSLPECIDNEYLNVLRECIENEKDAGSKSSLLFALGMMLEYRGDNKGEVVAYESANALSVPLKPYHAEGHDMAMSGIRDRYMKSQARELANCGDTEFRPIFIIGMPRSGTTLLEQVLGAHPQVESAGESTVMECVINDRMAVRGIEREGEYLASLDADEVHELAITFRKLIGNVAKSDSLFIAEKGMNNARDAGLLNAMFPNASFVYIRRHPLDVAWGCFKQNFSLQNFSFSYEGIAKHFAVFLETIDFWRRELPRGLHELSYESLVCDMQGTVEKLLEYVGLPWDDACLSFDKRKKEVVTASMNQIRQGLFTSAVGRWEKYGDLLLPLKRELEKAGVDLGYKP